VSAIRRLNSLSRQLIAFGAAVGALVVAVFVPATASALVEYPPGGFTLTLSAGTVPPGGAVTATVNGCDVGVGLSLSVDGTSISASATCGAAATAGFRRPAAPVGGSATLTINAPTTPGTYTVRVAETGGQLRSATATLTVAAAGATTVPVGSLPSTGSETGPVATVGAIVLVLGVGAVVIARRRHGLSA
jgi:LPXTG-motif cell wall-anchored protein